MASTEATKTVIWGYMQTIVRVRSSKRRKPKSARKVFSFKSAPGHITWTMIILRMLKGIHIASKHDQNISWSSHNMLLYHVALFQKQNTFCCALLDYKLINHLTSSSHTSYLRSTYPPHPPRVWQKCCQIHQLHGLARPAAVSSKTLIPGHRLILKQQVHINAPREY